MRSCTDHSIHDVQKEKSNQFTADVNDWISAVSIKNYYLLSGITHNEALEMYQELFSLQ